MATKKQTKVTFKNGHGRMYVKATFNTTMVSFTDDQGNVICWSSAGICGFKGARRSTPFAATTIIEEGLKRARAANLSSLEVYLKGPGPGKDAALKVIKNAGLEVTLIADVTPIPHNGARPEKPRRI
ncbi:30S ribosomal protein S11 [Candidatus Collierbacteria bacterium]|nr:30S ribosomal protein S11 [Candidatus Collierbacteria bacterium]